MSGAAPRKTWVYVLAGAVPALALIGLTFYVMSRALSDMGVAGGGRRFAEICVSRLRTVAEAQLLYAADNDERLPAAEKWVDASWSYAKEKRKADPEENSESAFRCPTVSARRDGSYGYAFNSGLGGQKTSAIADPDAVELVFDSKDLARNAHGDPRSTIPGPEGRHDGGRVNGVGYASGRAGIVPAGTKGAR